MTAKTKTNDASERNDLSNYDVAVMGRGNSAALTALALADAGFSVWAETAEALAENMPNNESAATWQRVLALSPGARRALEALGVWQRLEAGQAPVADIAVGGPDDRDLPLRFAADTGPNQLRSDPAHQKERAADQPLCEARAAQRAPPTLPLRRGGVNT